MDIVLIYGKFDILHAGHFRLFNFAKKFGQKLIVGLLNEATEKVSINLAYNIRYENLAHVSLIDEIVKYDDLATLIEKVKPQKIVKGHEFAQVFNSESKII